MAGQTQKFGGFTTNINDILDEDTMSSDSATALATQQSIKAYVDTKTASTDINYKVWDSNFPILPAGTTPGWVATTSGTPTYNQNYGVAGLTTGASTNNYVVLSSICATPATNSDTWNSYAAFSNLTSGTKVIFAAPVQFSSQANKEVRFGFASDANGGHSETTGVQGCKFKFAIDGALTLTASVITNDTSGTGTTTGISYSNAVRSHYLEIIWTVGTNVVFKVDGATVNTSTVDIPTGSDAAAINFFIGVKTTDGNGKAVQIANTPIIRIALP